ncbi:ran-binding protein 3 [Onthophagus taurus]|uniref:ran-binding protein 3 n=1 Tax=Onthophagus taurus TaxID=166361 RepID=UPI000C20C3D3|nr:ran-binding protein 3 [Onthophagus taurus]
MADGITDSEKASATNDQETKPSNVSEENANNESKEVEIPRICSPTVSKPILTQSHFGSSYSVPGVTKQLNSGTPPRLKNDAFLSKTSGTDSPARTKSILKPPTFTSGFKLKPSSLNLVTSFDKVDDEKNGNNENNIGKSGNSNGEGLKFVPLVQSEQKDSDKIIKPITTTCTQTQPIQTNFVFGQNLEERVIADDCRPSTSCSNSNGTSESLFSSAIKENNIEAVGTSSKEGKSLSESAREYEESRAVKRKYDEVEVITGEEGETNITHVSCKLFAYDSTSLSWQERGRGNLRLNDREVVEDKKTFKQSRLVFRTSGSLRVLMNTKIWADMMIQKAGPKSIRLTAMDSKGDIKVFLIMASIEDTGRLHKLLQDRVQSEQTTSCKQRKMSIETTKPESEKETTSSTET